MYSKVNALGIVVEPIYMPYSASTKLITEFLIIMLVVLTCMGGQITHVTALPITSKPIETTAENLAWQAWLMLPLEQKNQIQSRKVTPKSIFLLPLRGDCPPDHHKVDFKCIPITSGTNAMLIDPNVLGLLVGNTNHTFDYDYENESEELLATVITESKDANDYQGTIKTIRQDEPLKFNIFQNRFPTNSDEQNDDYFSLASDITDQNSHNATNNNGSLVLDSTTEIFNTTLLDMENLESIRNQSDINYNASYLFDDDTLRIINTAIGMENSNAQSNDADIIVNVTLAEILKKDALIPLRNQNDNKNSTDLNFVNSNTEQSNQDVISTNTEQYDTTTFASPLEEDLKLSQSKSEITTAASMLPNKIHTTTHAITPLQIYVPIVIRSKENLNATTKSKAEEFDSVSQSVGLIVENGSASTVASSIVVSDNEFSANNDKDIIKIAPTAHATSIATLQRNDELQATADEVSTTIKNDVQIELSSSTISSRGSDSFKHQTISEIYQIEEWRLINELASDETEAEVEVEIEQNDTTEHNLYDATTTELIKSYDKLGITPLTTRHTRITSSGKIIPRDLEIAKNANSSINKINHNILKNISTSVENDWWRLNTERDTTNIQLNVAATTTQIPLTNESQTNEYPIEPLLLKLWSAYKAAVRKRNY